MIGVRISVWVGVGVRVSVRVGVRVGVSVGLEIAVEQEQGLMLASLKSKNQPQSASSSFYRSFVHSLSYPTSKE